MKGKKSADLILSGKDSDALVLSGKAARREAAKSGGLRDKKPKYVGGSRPRSRMHVGLRRPI